MSAGALNSNSAVYDQSQTWRSYMSNILEDWQFIRR